MRTFRLVFLNSTVQVIGKLIAVAATFLVTAIITHSLGAAGYGEYTIFTAYAALFYMAADFGFNAIALQDAGTDENELKKMYGDLLGLRIVYGIILVFLAVAILNFFPYSPAVKLATIINCLTILLMALITTTNLVFQFKLRYDLSVLAVAVGDILTVALVYLLSQVGINILAIATVNVVALGINVFLALSFVGLLAGRIRPRFDLAIWKNLVVTTVPVGLTLVFNLVYFRADTFILSVAKSSTEVGIYGLAYKFFESALVMPTFIMNALYPILLRNYATDRADFVRNIRAAILWMAGLSTAGTIVAIIAAPYVFPFFGKQFTDSVLPFQILIASAPIYFLSSLYMWLMLIFKKRKTLALIYLLGMIINISLNLVFIPKYSYLAAALITGVSESFILLLTYYLSREWKYADRD